MAVTSFPSRQAPQLYQWELGSTSKSRQLKGFAFSVYTRLWKMDLFAPQSRSGSNVSSPTSDHYFQLTTANELPEMKTNGNFFFTESDRITFFNFENDFFETETQKTGTTLWTPFLKSFTKTLTKRRNLTKKLLIGATQSAETRDGTNKNKKTKKSFIFLHLS